MKPIHRRSSSSHHPPSSPSPLRQSWKQNNPNSSSEDNFQKNRQGHAFSSPTATRTEDCSSHLSFSLFQNSPSVATTTPSLPPSTSYSSKMSQLDFLPFTTLSSPSSNSSQPRYDTFKSEAQSQALEKRRRSIFSKASQGGPRFNRPKDQEEPSQTLFRQRFKDRCRAHMQRDRARALAKSRNGLRNSNEDEELTPGPSGHSNRRKPFIGSDDLMSSDVEEEDNSGEVEMDESWQSEDDELIRRIMLSEYRSIQKSNEIEGEKAISWLHDSEIDYLEEELKREAEEYHLNGTSNAAKKGKEKEWDPYQTPEPKRWVGERWYPVNRRRGPPNSLEPSSQPHFKSDSQTPSFIEEDDQAVLAQIEAEEAEDDPAEQYQAYLASLDERDSNRLNHSNDFNSDGMGEDLDYDDELDLEFNINEDELKELETRALQEKDVLRNKGGGDDVEMESLDQEMELL